MKCSYCKKDAPWGDNSRIYWRNIWKSYKCYYCKDCDAYVGCHNNSRKSLWTIANAELRWWRKNTHKVLDPIRQSWNISRSELYKFLEKSFKKEIHVGESDIEMCKRLINFLEYCKKHSNNNY